MALGVLNKGGSISVSLCEVLPRRGAEGRPNSAGFGARVWLCAFLSCLRVCVYTGVSAGIRVPVTNQRLSAPESLLTPRGCGGPPQGGLYPAGLVFHPSRWWGSCWHPLLQSAVLRVPSRGRRRDVAEGRDPSGSQWVGAAEGMAGL